MPGDDQRHLAMSPSNHHLRMSKKTWEEKGNSEKKNIHNKWNRKNSLVYEKKYGYLSS